MQKTVYKNYLTMARYLILKLIVKNEAKRHIRTPPIEHMTVPTHNFILENLRNNWCNFSLRFYYLLILNEKCLSVSPNFVTLSPIPLRLRFLERAWREKKNDTKIMGIPSLEKLKNQFFFIFAFML
jgi:hypothetical protein